MSSLTSEIKSVIVECLRLEGTTADEIGDETPLFGEGLGLDSLDALEVVVAIEHRYGFKLDLDAGDSRRLLANVGTLAAYVSEKRTK